MTTPLIRSAADIMADVDANPDAPPITEAPWHRWLPPMHKSETRCRGCGAPDVMAGRRFCVPCRPHPRQFQVGP